MKLKSKRERILVFSAVGITVIFLLFLVIRPLAGNLKRDREAIPDKMAALAKYRRFVANKDQAEKDLKKIEMLSQQSEKKLLSGDLLYAGRPAPICIRVCTIRNCQCGEGGIRTHDTG